MEPRKRNSHNFFPTIRNAFSFNVRPWKIVQFIMKSQSFQFRPFTTLIQFILPSFVCRRQRRLAWHTDTRFPLWLHVKGIEMISENWLGDGVDMADLREWKYNYEFLLWSQVKREKHEEEYHKVLLASYWLRVYDSIAVTFSAHSHIHIFHASSIVYRLLFFFK